VGWELEKGPERGKRTDLEDPPNSPSFGWRAGGKWGVGVGVFGGGGGGVWGSENPRGGGHMIIQLVKKKFQRTRSFRDVFWYVAKGKGSHWTR